MAEKNNMKKVVLLTLLVLTLIAPAILQSGQAATAMVTSEQATSTIIQSEQTDPTIGPSENPEPQSIKKLVIRAPRSVYGGNSFQVRVVDQNGNSVYRATVIFAGHVNVTNDAGYTGFTAPAVLAFNTYFILALKTGYLPGTARITVYRDN